MQSSSYCSLTDKVYTWEVRHPFFLYAKTIRWRIYLDMLELYVVPHLEELQPFISIHDGAPPHWNNSVQTFLNETFYGRRIWPWWVPWSPDITPLNFFQCGVCKGLCVQNICGWHCKPLCKDNWEKLMCGKTNVDHAWAELDCQYDVIRATGCSYVEVD